VAYYFIGMFFNLALPTSVGGDVVRAWYLASRSGVSGQRLGAFLSVLADRVNGLVVLVFLAGVAYICCPLALPTWIGGCVVGAEVATMVGLVVFLVLIRRSGCSRSPLPPRTSGLGRLMDGASVYRNYPGVLTGATILSLGVQAANVVLYWLVGRALGLGVPLSYYGILMPLVTLLTLVPISLNGMGLREVGTVLLLGPLGVRAETAVTLSLLTFAVYTTASLGGAGFYLFGQFPRFQMGKEERGDAEPVRGDPDQGRARQPASAA
jgi:uncharacterized membrane protein YbhN (UPF0104 family)